MDYCCNPQCFVCVWGTMIPPHHLDSVIIHNLIMNCVFFFFFFFFLDFYLSLDFFYCQFNPFTLS
jgi:hypothetical protein